MSLLPAIDHLVLACPDLTMGRTWVKNILGINPEPGGVHEGYGTHNVLIGLGKETYLEILAPDPNQSLIPAHWIPADTVRSPRLIGWASSNNHLKSFAERHSNLLGKYAKMKRKRPDGSMIHWEMTYPRFEIMNGLIPFFVNWKQTPHPGSILKAQGSITSFQLYHPKTKELKKSLSDLGIQASILFDPIPHLKAEIAVNNQIISLT